MQGIAHSSLALLPRRRSLSTKRVEATVNSSTALGSCVLGSLAERPALDLFPDCAQCMTDTLPATMALDCLYLEDSDQTLNLSAHAGFTMLLSSSNCQLFMQAMVVAASDHQTRDDHDRRGFEAIVRQRSHRHSVQALVVLLRPNLGTQQTQTHLHQTMVEMDEHQIVSPVGDFMVDESPRLLWRPFRLSQAAMA